MAVYRVVKCSIWGEEWFVESSSDTKVLFMYLFQAQQTTACGALKQAIRTIAATTNLSPKRVKEILAELSPRVIYNPSDGVIWVKYFYRHQASNPNYAKSAIAALNDFPTWVRAQFEETYPELFPDRSERQSKGIDTLPEGLDNHIDTLPQGLAKGIDTVSNPTSTSEQASASEQEKMPPNPPEGDLRALVHHRPDDFVRIRERYRNKNSPEMDAKAWDKLKPDDAMIARMEAVICAEEIAPDEIPHIQAFSVFCNQRTFYASVPFKGLLIYREQKAKGNVDYNASISSGRRKIPI